MPTNSEGYVSQEYHPYNSSNTYWRNYDTHSGTWSTWKLKTTDLFHKGMEKSVVLVYTKK